MVGLNFDLNLWMKYQPKVNSDFQETGSKTLVLFAEEATEMSF